VTRGTVDPRDIQAIARTAFDSLNGAAYILLRVADPAAARAWLRGQEPACVADVGADKPPIEETVQIAFTASGLRALGIEEEIICRFPLEFVEGMAGSENRSRRLGDIGVNAPERWDWGAGEREPHVLLILLAPRANRISTYVEALRRSVELSGFSLPVAPLTTSDMRGHEPFGFKDGVSQPSFDWEAAREPGTVADLDYTNEIALGELLLGHRNEYGLFTERPLIKSNEKNAHVLAPAGQGDGQHDLGLNGSYLVYRQLKQDAVGFWRWIADEAARAGTSPDDLAEAMVGRRLDGSPLHGLVIEREIPGVYDHAKNGFAFKSDPEGLSCPIGAHIRRANPRTGDAPYGRQGAVGNLLVTLGLNGRPRPGETSSTRPWPHNSTIWPGGRAEDDAISSSRFHRILRRGREYGEPVDRKTARDATACGHEAGLHFLCLNANIARQFEFIQSAWVASATFGALSGEQDPLLGNREPFPAPPVPPTGNPTDGFTRPGADPACRHSTHLPRFVTVRGGAYFFLPGLRALQWIASD
jgi:deferrochelatase/peroxidase EfeB